MTALANILVLLFGLLICGLSAWGVFTPRVIMRLVTELMDGPWGIGIAVVVRLVLGAALIIAADGSRYPLAFEIIGWLAIVAAIAIVIMGRSRLKSFVSRIAGFSDAMLRVWLVGGVVFGGFLVYAAG